MRIPTGLKDSNGKDVFLWDTIETTYSNGDKFVETVRERNGWFVAMLDFDGIPMFANFPDGQHHDNVHMVEYRVIDSE